MQRHSAPPPLPGLRGAWFLAKQPWMLGPAALGTLAWTVFVLSTPMQNGHGTAGDYAVMLALGPMLGFGLAALTGLPGFMLYRLLATPKPAWAPAPGEEVLFETRANHIRGDEGRGGRLHVTDRRLVFVPHRFNVQLDLWEARLEEIASVKWAQITNARGMPITTVLYVDTAAGTQIVPAPSAEQVAALVDALRELPPEGRAAAGRERAAWLGLGAAGRARASA